MYLVSGFEFTEYYFVVSADRRELIAIDAGTRADSAQAAHEALRARFPALPPLTTVMITHALGPRRRLSILSAPESRCPIHRSQQLPGGARARRHGEPRDPQRSGQRFRLEDVLSYKPDMAIDKQPIWSSAGMPLDCCLRAARPQTRC